MTNVSRLSHSKFKSAHIPTLSSFYLLHHKMFQGIAETSNDDNTTVINNKPKVINNIAIIINALLMCCRNKSKLYAIIKIKPDHLST